MLTVLGKLLPEGHILPKNTYESQRLLRALKMPYEPIHACPNGCVLFRKDHEKATHCPKCKSSRYLEVDTSDGKKEQLGIPAKVLEGRFDINMFSLMGMEVDNDIDQDDGDEDDEEVQNAKDLQMLERLQLGDDNDDNDGDEPDLLDNIDSDDDTYDPATADREEYF